VSAFRLGGHYDQELIRGVRFNLGAGLKIGTIRHHNVCVQCAIALYQVCSGSMLTSVLRRPMG